MKHRLGRKVPPLSLSLSLSFFLYFFSSPSSLSLSFFLYFFSSPFSLSFFLYLFLFFSLLSLSLSLSFFLYFFSSPFSLCLSLSFFIYFFSSPFSLCLSLWTWYPFPKVFFSFFVFVFPSCHPDKDPSKGPIPFNHPVKSIRTKIYAFFSLLTTKHATVMSHLIRRKYQV